MGNNTISSSIYSVMLLAISMAACVSTFAVPSSAKSLSSSFSFSAEAEALLKSGWWAGVALTNFSLKNHCYLKGITCNRAGSVIRMEVHFFYSHGRLSNMSWSSLPNLGYLDISDSDLIGGIPGEIGTLSKLTHLDLSYNFGLQGVLPPDLGNLTQLVHLDLSVTDIGGPIPSTIGNLSSLAYLSLYSNQLSGSIPPEIGNLKNLVEMDLSSNNFRGPIPSSIGHLSNLAHLYLHSSQLDGPIPCEIGKLQKLDKVDMSYNNLHGPIPREIGNLSGLTYLALDRNDLVGTIPNELAYLPLKYLNLSQNNLSGTCKFASKLRFVPVVLDLSYNLLDCQIPNRSPNGCPNEPKFRPSMLRLSQEFLSRRKALATPLRTVSLWNLWNRKMDFVHQSNEQVISAQV
ncbi:hypothetical protein RHSIM_Rhsim10G0032500 [Rhododendron simsii]|uniref:Disease resistance R13L4/SHOC-2-like LRR domain-containing protein n=1 Tax=Rhododendron simsii TaxID=118357 RepID=A0A834GAM6_RHOSS|nr:hypothetical protein RHSIM_Rhsim10G0032500 [Rhododendron simsii]